LLTETYEKAFEEFINFGLTITYDFWVNFRLMFALNLKGIKYEYSYLQGIGAYCLQKV
jgi:hypothetical protein